MRVERCYLTKNDCYKSGRTIKPSGIVVHTTGCVNKTLKRYVQPDDGLIGKNTYGNDWNRSGVDACVHAFIGEDKNGDVRCYQTLPWTMRCWGVASGKNGSYNNNHIQFEICEGTSSDKNYAKKAYELAVDLCVYLCKKYSLTPDKICGHYEAYQRGYGSNHSDPKPYFAKFGYSMDGLRKDVKNKLSSASSGNQDNTAKTESKKVKYTKALQAALNASYGSGLEEDGSAGPLTQACINKHYLYYKTPTIRNAHVSWLQDAFKAQGYTITVDGSFGPATEKVVKQFQRDHGLVVDGYAGVKTHLMILGLL